MDNKKIKIASFRFRILAALLLLTYGSVSLFFIVSYRSALRSLEDSYLESQTEQMRIRLELLDDQLGTMYRLAVQVSQSPALAQAVTRYLSTEAPPMREVIHLSEQLQQEISASQASLLFLYLPERKEIICSDELHIRRTVTSEIDYPWIAAAQGSSFTPAFFYDGNGGSIQNYYGYSKPLHTDTGHLLGMIYIALDERKLFYELLNRAGNSWYFLCDEQGRIYSSTQRDCIGQNIRENLPFPVDGNLSGTISGSVGRHLLVGVSASFSGMRLLAVSERSVLQNKLNGTRITFVVLLLGIVLLAMQTARMMQRWLYQPIDSLMQHMERAGHGDLRVRWSGPQPLEFQKLSGQFNQMLEQIDGLLDSLLEERLAKRQAELRALQYQIRPHFMYNTLNSIKFAAILQGNEKIGEQIGAFVSLLEASISKKGAFIRVEEEIALLENYISLQRFRYMDCFTVVYDIAPAAKDYYVPRLILQPLVENAILHGMDIKQAGNEIYVAAMVEGETLWLAVQDNGKGMSAEEQRHLLDNSMDGNRQFTGIGVANIQERLRMYYGDKSRFYLVSAPGQGTSIVLELPASRDGEAYSI